MYYFYKYNTLQKDGPFVLRFTLLCYSAQHSFFRVDFTNNETLSNEEEEETDDVIQFTLLLTAIVIAGLADAVTVYILRRFKMIQRDHQNVYIFHISVLNLISIPFGILALIDTAEVTDDDELLSPEWWYFLLMNIVPSFVFAQFSLMAVMTIYWYLFTFAPQTSIQFRKYSSNIIISAYVYVSVIPLFSILMFYLWSEYYLIIFPTVISICTLLFSFILYLTFGLIYFCRRKNLPTTANATVLKMSLIKIIVWLLLITSLWIVTTPSEEIELLDDIVVFFVLLAIITPLLQLILFYFWDTNYKAALFRTFCRRKANQMESGATYDI